MSSNPDAAPPSARGGLFTRLGRGLAALLGGQRAPDAALLEELEALLLGADVGIEATQAILAQASAAVARGQLQDAAALHGALRQAMLAIVQPCARPLVIPRTGRPFVIMVVGVNGTGKTTTIGKLARRLKARGLNVMLAAADTFRAAAVEQLKTWGERNAVPVIAQGQGADAAAVAHDAMQAAAARAADVLIVDTAGRLHTQGNLMDELKKIRRVIARFDAEAPHETLLVLDAGIGQNALTQLEQFHQAVGVTGLALTKLDGTARGGILFAIARKTGMPIRFIGVGEAIEDLREFDAGEFVDAILPEKR
ncbi:MAG TPA: signal recognition particle-docking protein FtsY [Acidiferrobacterales bacterium]